MPRDKFSAMHCSVARTSAVVADPWALLVLRDVFLGLHGYDELREDLGIATNVLAQRLDDLVGHGVLERRRYSEHPVRHSYHPTAAGEELYGVVLALMAWGRPPPGRRRAADPRRRPPLRPRRRPPGDLRPLRRRTDPVHDLVRTGSGWCHSSRDRGGRRPPRQPHTVVRRMS